MRKLTLLAAAAVVALGCNKSQTETGNADPAKPSLAEKALSFLGAAAFEGQVTGETTNKLTGGAKQTIVWGFKGDKVRYDLPAQAGIGGGWVLIDGSTHKVYMINDTQKMVMTIDPDAKSKTGAPAPGDEPKIEKTGKHEVIAGYDCEDWKIEQKGKKSEACITDGLTFSFGSPRDSSGDWTQTLVKEKRFPLRMVRFAADGSEEMRVEVTKVERKAMDAAQFEVPAGYKEMDLGGLLGGMMGGQGGPGGPAGSIQLPPGMKLPPGVKLPPGMNPPPK